jgi:excisionase family DNA binding protein
MESNNRRTPYKQLLRGYPDVLDVKQMSEILQICTKTAYALLQGGKVDALKVGRAYKIPKLNLIKYLQL